MRFPIFGSNNKDKPAPVANDNAENTEDTKDVNNSHSVSRRVAGASLGVIAAGSGIVGGLAATGTFDGSPTNHGQNTEISAPPAPSQSPARGSPPAPAPPAPCPPTIGA